MGIIDEKLLIDFLGIAGATIKQPSTTQEKKVMPGKKNIQPPSKTSKRVSRDEHRREYEELFKDVFGIEVAEKRLSHTSSLVEVEKEEEEVMPVREKREKENIQTSIKKTELFSYRHKRYKNFKEALRASGFTPFTADKFGRGEDDYKGNEEKILDYLIDLYTGMYGSLEKEYYKDELEEALKRIDELREYV